jgi:hypothetical protein
VGKGRECLRELGGSKIIYYAGKLSRELKAEEVCKEPIFTKGGEERWRLIKKGSVTTATLGTLWISLLILAMLSLPFLPPLNLGSKLVKAGRELLHPRAISAEVSGDTTSAILTLNSSLLLRSAIGGEDLSQTSLKLSSKPTQVNSEKVAKRQGLPHTSFKKDTSAPNNSGKMLQNPTSPGNSTQPLQKPETPAFTPTPENRKISSPPSTQAPEYVENRLSFPSGVREKPPLEKSDVATEKAQGGTSKKSAKIPSTFEFSSNSSSAN